MSLVRFLVSSKIFSIIVGVAYYIMNIQNNQKNQELTLKAQQQQLETRQAQLFMQIYSHWYTTDFWDHWETLMNYDFKDYNQYVEKLTPEISRSNRTLFSFFEGLGVLVKRELIDPYLIDDLLSAIITSYWNKMKPFWIEYRVRHNTPMAGE